MLAFILAAGEGTRVRHIHPGDIDGCYIDGGISIIGPDLIRRARTFYGGFEGYLNKILVDKRVASYMPRAWFDIGTLDAYRHTCDSESFKALFVKQSMIDSHKR